MSTHSRHAWGSKDVFFYILSTRTRLNNPIGHNWAMRLIRGRMSLVGELKIYKAFCIHY